MAESLYIVAMTVDEHDMPTSRKSAIVNFTTITLVAARDVAEACDKAATVFPPDMLTRNNTYISVCKDGEKCQCNAIWRVYSRMLRDHLEHTPLTAPDAPKKAE